MPSFVRKVLSSSEESRKKYGTVAGDNVLVFDNDIFSLKLEGRKVDCVMDMDILAKQKINLAV